ncbi:hypothetical protein EDEG_03349 [Edhazardia aedis USNM 41457]|uniref:Uncharacterized protein n=1 Tax=Edhazardia aedis (strain USNM 41457) TaxID=1003232 RepID=J9DHV2_EDHAE|nr:hypothetical protein EDEG_03349 [Edhazardia aedis USNM 41457]|eukprot:EJW02195.1 hypothetical protein EDEG_03349 [Edhazardia aedis USNM 41457]
MEKCRIHYMFPRIIQNCICDRFLLSDKQFSYSKRNRLEAQKIITKNFFCCYIYFLFCFLVCRYMSYSCYQYYLIFKYVPHYRNINYDYLAIYREHVRLYERRQCLKYHIYIYLFIKKINQK